MIVKKQKKVSEAVAGAQLQAIASYLPLRNLWDILPFLRMSGRVEKQLRETPGLILYGLRANIFTQRFWTYSLWTDRASVTAFVKKEPHAAAVQIFPRWAGRGASFAEWQTTNASVDWKEALERLKTPTFKYGGKAGSTQR